MTLAGLAEFILGNTFPFVVFTIYGCHFFAHGYILAPSNLVVSFYDVPDGTAGAMSSDLNAGQGNYFLVMAVTSFLFLLGGMRTNGPFVVVFFGLGMVFSLVAAGSYQLARNPTDAGLALTAYYYKIAGGFGVVILAAGW